MKLPANCFVCGKEFKDAFGHEYAGISTDYNAPFGGTTFSSSGNYGSGVYDPPMTGGSHIEINICDGCLTARLYRVLEVEVVHTPRVHKYKRFEIED